MNRSKIALIVAALAIAGTVIAQAISAREGALTRTAAAPAPAGPGGIVAEGRVAAYPDAEAAIGTEVRGTIVRLNVHEKSAVRKGDVLAELRSDDLRAAVAEARAKVVEADADIELAKVEVDRAERTWQQAVGTKQTLDRARRDLEAGRARRASAVATVARLEAELAKTRIVAPIDGVVIERDVEPGETVEAGARLLTIADLSRRRVEAEVDEYDAGRLAVGAPVQVTAEGFSGTYRAVVEEIPDAVVARRLRPQDPSRPVDTRVLMTKVRFLEPVPFKLGQRVDVRIAGAS
ncbi:MAG TPA: efflux RND transporter periplasmic adaptor subunit [Thermoanaerobaculaceae bacterium]|nr:efflux RND transporter periplasmic adaptor subunit [Thermoanaerobaculaceae bacterium]